MHGRQVLMETLVGHGVELLFGNPGTTESPILDSLDAYPQIRYILTLHEGIALGAASYYAQATGRTGVVNLHVAPGLGNALGMLYDALKAGSPLVVTAGQQDTRMRLRAPLLGHDLVAMAAPLTKWSVQVERADELAAVLHRAFKIAHDPPRGPVFVALPIDVLEQETEDLARPPSALYLDPEPDPAGVSAAAALLRGSRRPAIVAGDDAARDGGPAELIALADLLGASVWVEGLRQHSVFPSGHPCYRGPLPFDAAAIRKALDGADAVLLVGGPFFEEVWYAPGSPFEPGAAVIQIESSAERLAPNFPLQVGLLASPRTGLRALRVALATGDGAWRGASAARRGAFEAQKAREVAAQRSRAAKRWDDEPISIPRLMGEIERALPADAIVVDESITASIELARVLSFDGPGDYFGARGGGIGQALPGALGVKLAHPRRPVVALSGDGSAMYSIQALWTAAHHELAVVFVILDNREYRILKHNMDVYRQRFEVKGEHRPYAHMDLAGPAISFPDIAQGMGVAAARVTRPADLGPALAAALRSGTPYLLDVAVEGKR
jgi:benzoylformate decarboxylase